MSLRLNPAQVVSQEFKVLKSTVEGFSSSTPLEQITQAKGELEAMKGKIKDIVQKTPAAMMGLAVVDKGIPSLIKRCETFIPSDFVQQKPVTPPVEVAQTSTSEEKAPVQNEHSSQTTEVVPTLGSTGAKTNRTSIHGLTFLTTSRPGFKEGARKPLSTLRPRKADPSPALTSGIAIATKPSAPVVTAITVKSKVPFGHSLTIRGQGGDLDWSKGKALEKIDDETYVYRMQGLTGKVEYKILLDDAQWEGGANRTLEAEKSQEVVPALVIPKVPVVINLDAGSNKVFIRGTGPGMSWEKGLEMKSVGGKYVLESAADLGSFEFKVLLNDQQWSQGENFKAENGKTLEITPRF